MAYGFDDDKSKKNFNDVIKVKEVTLLLSGLGQQTINAGAIGSLEFEFLGNTDLSNYYVIGVKNISVLKQNNAHVNFFNDLIVNFFPGTQLTSGDKYSISVKNVSSEGIQVYKKHESSYSYIKLLALEILK